MAVDVHTSSPLPIRAGRTIARPAVESLPTTWAMQDSEFYRKATILSFEW